MVYIGVGAGWSDGLRHRLRCELGWVLDAEDWSEEERPLRFSAHPRTMVKRQAQAWCWPTETAAQARQSEAELLELSVLEAGAPPLLNGKAWWSDSGAATRVREWWEVRRAAHRVLAS